MRTLEAQHKNWMEVTGSAINDRHKTDGYKGAVKQQVTANKQIKRSQSNEEK